MMADMTDSRLTRLETKLDYVEEGVSELKVAVNKLSDTLNQERLELAKYAAKLGLLYGGGGAACIAVLNWLLGRIG
jgi:uncharacterized coiled-coil protein SlyX